MTFYRNCRAAYSSYNFRSDDGRFEWQRLQDRWRTDRLLAVTDEPRLLGLLEALTASPLARALGGISES